MFTGATPRNERIIALDSGIGGLAIARAIVDRIPAIDLHYRAADEGFPYGDWQTENLNRRLCRLLSDLQHKIAADAVVIACNTLSTHALPQLRACMAAPVVGTVPAIRPAAALTRTGMISVIDKAATASSPYLQALIEPFADGKKVRIVATPDLAALAEHRFRGEAIDSAALAREIRPAFVEAGGRRTDVVVLGCTHYPLLLEELKAVAPGPVAWLDPAEAVASQLMRVLYPSYLIGGPHLPGRVSFQSTSTAMAPEVQVRMRERCRRHVLSSPEGHLLKGVSA